MKFYIMDAEKPKASVELDVIKDPWYTATMKMGQILMDLRLDLKPKSELDDLVEDLKPHILRNLSVLAPVIQQLPNDIVARLTKLGIDVGRTTGESKMDQKGWLQSKTVWGVAMMLIPQIATMFGLKLTGDDVSMAIQYGTTIIEAAGALLAIIGRVTAKTSLSGSPIIKN